MPKRRRSEDMVRAHVRNLTPYSGVDPIEVLAERSHIGIDKVIKLDANENPYGASPRVQEALGSKQVFSLYPDPLQRKLRQSLADYINADPQQIVAGAGADELIELVIRLFIARGDKVIDLPPTFGMYPITTKIYDGQVVQVERNENFEVDLVGVKESIDQQTKLIFLANPNNPTGTLTPEADVRELLDLGLIVAVDETYHEFSGFTVAHLIPEYDNLIVIRTFSKWAGLAGLRIGYGIMSPTIANHIMAIKTPYNISTAAEIAVLATLEDTNQLLHQVRVLVEEREMMAQLLSSIPGTICFPSKGNFILCKFPDGAAATLHARLADKGIFVRAFKVGRLMDYLRISIGKSNDNLFVIQTIQEIMGEIT